MEGLEVERKLPCLEMLFVSLGLHWFPWLSITIITGNTSLDTILPYLAAVLTVNRFTWYITSIFAHLQKWMLVAGWCHIIFQFVSINVIAEGY